MNKSNICYDLTIINNEFFIDSIYDYNNLSNKEIRIIHSNCSYICDICKNDYMYKGLFGSTQRVFTWPDSLLVSETKK